MHVTDFAGATSHDCGKGCSFFNVQISFIGGEMDNVTVIRVVSGILAAIIFVILVLRMRKKTTR